MPAQFSNLRFIVNPQAGTQRGDMEAAIRRLLSRTGVGFDICHSEYQGHGTELAREAANEGADLVVAVGGDGTINEVGRGLLGLDTPLGIIPLGSGNALASGLGIPIHPARACRGLLRAEVRAIDVGKMGEAVFFSTAGAGVDAEVCWRFNRRSGRRGFLTYAVLSLAAFKAYKSEEVRVTLDEGRELRVRPTVLTVANSSQFGNGAVIAPRARPDDGLLDLCIVEDIGLPRTLWHMRRLFTGTIEDTPGAQYFQTRGLRIERGKPGRFQVDGESMTGDATLEVTVMPKAIQIAIPKQ